MHTTWDYTQGTNVEKGEVLPYNSQEVYQRNVTTFVLLGFSNIGRFQLLLFIVLLVIYCVTIYGNLLIITLVSFSQTLHTPMYFFLTQLAIADILMTTDIAPNMLNMLRHKQGSISFYGCITQMYLFGSSEASECLLLMVMSYDRYLAICSPLHYTMIMNQSLCIKLVLASWLLSCCLLLMLTLEICKLQFCGPNTIDHFFCDFEPLVKLSCSDISIVQREDIFLVIPLAVVPFFVIVGSYTKIVLTILKISSISGKLKSFSTCSAHLTVVSILYGTLIVMYMLPSEGRSKMISKAMAMMYTTVTPFLNPLIYSLRNKDIKNALNIIYRKII
ncbi:olfactory receptor 10A7-like [Gastrophryne carolinensis]